MKVIFKMLIASTFLILTTSYTEPEEDYSKDLDEIQNNISIAKVELLEAKYKLELDK